MIIQFKRFWNSLSPDLRWILLAIFLSGIAEGLTANFHTLYLQYLKAKPQEIGATLGIAGVATIFVYIPIGMLADRGRRKLIILVAWVSTVVTFTWLALAPDWRWAIPGFMLYTFSSFARPAFSAQIATSDRGGNLNRTFSLTLTSFSLGSLLAPALGGWIGEHFGLRIVFASTGLVYLCSTLALLPISSQAASTVRPSVVRLGRILTDRPFLWLIVVLMLNVFAINLGILLAPNYMQDVKGLNLPQIGTLGTFAALGGIVVTLSLGRIRAERRTPLLAVQLAGLLALVFLLASPVARGGALPLLAVLAYFFRGGTDAIWLVMSGRLGQRLSPEILSMGFAFRDTAVRLALTFAPLAAGQLYGVNPELPLYVSLALTGATMLLTLTLPNHRPVLNADSPQVETPQAESVTRP